jgi:hypothetical protein
MKRLQRGTKNRGFGLCMLMAALLFSTMVTTVLPLFVITAGGLSLVPKPASSTARKSLVPGSYQLRVKSAVARIAASASIAAQSRPEEIHSFSGNLCLQPVNESTAQGAAVVQEPCNGGAAQKWTPIHVSGNIIHYVNGLSGLCLDARGRAVNGTPVQLWTCNWISNENWERGEINELNEPLPTLISRVSGTRSHCLDMPRGQMVAGLAMQIYRCNGTPAQVWWTP